MTFSCVGICVFNTYMQYNYNKYACVRVLHIIYIWFYYIYIYAHIYIYVCVYVYIHAYICVYTCVFVCIFIYIYMIICVCACVFFIVCLYTGKSKWSFSPWVTCGLPLPGLKWVIWLSGLPSHYFNILWEYVWTILSPSGWLSELSKR